MKHTASTTTMGLVPPVERTYKYGADTITVRAVCGPQDREDALGQMMAMAECSIDEWRQFGTSGGDHHYRFDAGAIEKAEGAELSVQVEVLDAEGTDRDGGYVHTPGWQEIADAEPCHVCGAPGPWGTVHCGRVRG